MNDRIAPSRWANSGFKGEVALAIVEGGGEVAGLLTPGPVLIEAVAISLEGQSQAIRIRFCKNGPV